MNGEETLGTPPMDASPQDSDGPLGRSAATGTLWLTGQKWASRISGLVTVAVLTRLVSPSDFGVVAAASSVTPFVLLLADLGFSTYLVQARRPDQRVLSTGFWFSVTAGLVLTGSLVLVAPLIADAFHLPEATPVIRVMALSVPLVVLGTVPEALLRRRMAFRRLAVQGTVAAVTGQVVAVVVAVRGGGAWALVWQLLAQQSVALVLVWWAARWRPSRQFSGVQFRSMAGFGVKVVSVDLISTAGTTAQAAIISSTLGAAALGYFAIAQRLIRVAQDLGAVALVPVATVVFAKVRESPDRLRSAYVKALGVAYGAVSPILTLILVGAPLIVPLLFGKEWGESIPVAQALALAAILTLGAMLDHSLYLGLGRPGGWLAYSSVTDGAAVLVTALMAPLGLTAVALGFAVVALVATIVRWVLVGRLIGVRPSVLAGVLGRASVAISTSAVAGAATLAITRGLLPAVSLALVGTTIAMVYLATVRVVSPNVIHEGLRVLPVPDRIRSWPILR